MPVRVPCNCGRSLLVKDELAGQSIRCPACQAILSVPFVRPEEPLEALPASRDEVRADPPAPPRPAREEERLRRPILHTGEDEDRFRDRQRSSGSGQESPMKAIG